MSEEECDAPSTGGGVEETTARLARTAFSIDGVSHRLADLIETFRGYMEKRSASMHRVAISIGGSMFLVIVALVLVIGACGVVIGLDIAERADQARQWAANTAGIEREWQRDTKAMNDHADDLARKYRMAELKYDELNLTVRRAGIGRTDDDQTGVGGNLDPEAFGKGFIYKHRRK
jgi:hypothetical protein